MTHGLGDFMSKTAVAGTFQTFGDDFIRFVDSSGNTKFFIDSSGTVYCNDVVTQSGVSLSALGLFTGFNLNLDMGTF